MKGTLIAGIALILLGSAILAYGHFHYQSRETLVKIGDFKIEGQETKTVPLPPILGWGLLGAGVCVLVFSGKTKT